MNILKVQPLVIGFTLLMLSAPAKSELIDQTQTPNTANEGIHKSLQNEMGAGRGNASTANSSVYLINRDPFRSIRRGRQLFQRKFTRQEGQGPRVNDGEGLGGEINLLKNDALGAGLSDSCAGCHARPRGSAGFGGDVATRPDSRDAPHLFGLGLKEMLADEITADLRRIRDHAVSEAHSVNHPVTRDLHSKKIRFGAITANPDGSVDTSNVSGVDPDLRVRPFLAHGGRISIREFAVGAFNAEMGLQSPDSDLARANSGNRVVTPSGMVLDGSRDAVEAPPTTDHSADPDRDGVANEIPVSLIDHMEFYLLNYFKPATYRHTESTMEGKRIFNQIRCSQCHIPNLTIEHDRRVADVETTYDPVKGVFNRLFATVIPLFIEVNDGTGLPALKLPKGGRFVVKNIFTDFKRHDLGPNFYERNYDGTLHEQFMTTPLWGVGSTAPYGHDGRSINLAEVILRHGGEAQESRDAFAKLEAEDQDEVIAFLNQLVLFPPDDTASTLNAGNPSAPGFPQNGHGSIKLPVLFNDPTELE
jgi:hypothetical protein